MWLMSSAYRLPMRVPRPLARIIQKRIENPLAGRILAGEFEAGDRVVVDAAAVYGSTPFEATRTGLYVLRLEDGRPVVYRHAFDTGRTTRVASLAATALTPEVSFAVSPDDTWIYYTRRDRIESDLMLVAPSP